MIKIPFIFYRPIALRTLSMNLPDQRVGNIYTQEGRAETIADIDGGSGLRLYDGSDVKL